MEVYFGILEDSGFVFGIFEVGMNLVCNGQNLADYMRGFSMVFQLSYLQNTMGIYRAKSRTFPSKLGGYSRAMEG